MDIRKYLETKKRLFQKLEEAEIGSKQRSKLLTKFNNTMRDYSDHSAYPKKLDEACQYCHEKEVQRIYADDEYYDICQNCELEQEA